MSAPPVTRDCPFCAETIKVAAIRCRYCGSDLPPLESAPPARPAQPRVTREDKPGTLSAEDMTDLLHSLVDRSLVVWDEAKERHRLLESVRQYARERLHQTGEGALVRNRHARHFAALATKGEPELSGSDQVAWLERFDAEHENLRAALDACETFEQAHVHGMLLASTARFWYMRGHIREARSRLSEAVKTLRTDEPTVVFARILAWLGVMAWQQADLVEARGHYEESLAIRRAMNDLPGVASCLNNMGLLAGDQGDFAESARLHQASMALSREMGDEVGLANSLNNLGILAWRQGELAQARELFQECIIHRRALGDRNGEAATLCNLGLVARAEGDLDAAAEHHEQSYQIFLALGDQSGAATATLQLADLDRLGSRPEEGRRKIALALAVFRATGDRWSEAAALLSLGDLLLIAENVPEAARSYAASAEIWASLGQHAGVTRSLEGMAACAVTLGQAAEAVTILGGAEVFGTEVPLPDDLGTPISAEEVLESARRQLTASAVDRLRERGKSMELRLLLEVIALPDLGE